MRNLNLLKKLYGDLDIPIYIYAPAYLEASAGVRALHYLCHALNSMGQPAWMVIHGVISKGSPLVNASLITPLLTPDIRNQHFACGQSPIVIYPETIPGNPLNAQFVVRWVLNYAGVLGGQTTFPDDEYLLAYSSKISKSLSGKPPILFLPPLNILEIWRIQTDLKAEKHNGKALTYAGKYRGFVGKPVLPNWAQNFETEEIWREGPNKQSRTEVLKLIRNAPVLFCFENSTIITESVLLGTPVILIRSTFFDELLGEHELGIDGTAWHDEVNPLDKAKKSLASAEVKYLKSIEDFHKSLQVEVVRWKKLANGTDYLKPLLIPDHSHLISKHRINLAIQILKNHGMITLIRISVSFLRRRLFTK